MAATTSPSEVLLKKGDTIAVAESLTGGLVCATLVQVPGISEILRGGVVSYTNEIKAHVLDVDRDLLNREGPVNGQVAVQMARGVAELTGATHTVSTTGVAGPGPADGFDAGTVWIGREDGRATLFLFPGGREDIRESSVLAALYILAEMELPEKLAKFRQKIETWK